MEQVVRAATLASVAAGQPLSQRAMAERFGLSRRRVSQLVTEVTASGNGHLPEKRGGMNMKPYDEMPWWCQLLWPWFGPPWYEQVDDLDTYLAMYWCALHLSAAEQADCWPVMTRR